MTQKNFNEKSDKGGRNAFFTFVTGSTIIYGSALAFCIHTENYFAAQLMGGAMLVVAGIVFYVYRTLRH